MCYFIMKQRGVMYQSYEAVVRKGKIQLIEKVKLKDATRMLVTIVGEEGIPALQWAKLRNWIKKQRKTKKITSYSSSELAKQHLQRLSK